MLLTKLKITVLAAGLMLLTGIGATGLTYRATAQQPNQGLARASRSQADDLDSLRLEIEALRKSLQATRERVKALEGEVSALKGQGSARAGMMGGAGDRQGGAKRGMMGGAGPAPKTTEPGSAPVADPAAQPRNQLLPGERGLPKAPSNPLEGRRPPVADPLADAEAALQQLRKDPSDEKAAKALERALQPLKQKEQDKPRE
jgi:hypothetical protein